MKKTVFTLFASLALLVGSSAWAQTDGPLTFGVISDIHFGNGVGEGPMVKVPQALKNLTSQSSLDVLAVVGDLTNNGYASEYEQLTGVFQDGMNFTNPVGKLLFMMGNHDNFDASGKSHYQEGLKAFNGGEPYPYHTYTVVKGYPFITLSEFSGDSQDTGNLSSGNSAYPEDNVAILESYLEQAATECPGKPIFVFTHVPPRWTVYGAWPEYETGGAWCMQVLNPVLNKYPQAVVFSGHSHYPLGDPRSIHQGANPRSPRQNYYTVINTASTTYSEINPGAVAAGIHPEKYDYVTEGLILKEQPNGDIEVRRFDTYRNVEIGASQRWLLKAPFDGSQFEYADIRDADDNPDGRSLRDGLPAPSFGTGAAFAVDAMPYRATLTIPQATDDECVFRYRIRVSKGNMVISERYIFSQFYLNTEMPQTLTCTLNGLQPDTEYGYEVVAYDSYDNASDPVTAIFTTPSASAGGGAAEADARWTFDDASDLMKVASGNFILQPIAVGKKSVEVVATPDEVGITPTTGRTDSDGAAFVPKDAGFKVVRPSGAPVSNDYTIMMDIMMENTSSYNGLYQTNISNSNDGDLFVYRNKIGMNAMGGYFGELDGETWYRVILCCRGDGRVYVYVDGEQVISCTTELRWEIDPWGFYLFCDEDGEMNDTYVSEVAFWEYGLSDSEVKAVCGLTPGPETPYLKVLTEGVKVVDNLDFHVTVDTNVPFTFRLPDWIEAVDFVPFVGEHSYLLRAKPMQKQGKRAGIITVEADGLEPQLVEVEQTYVGDEIPEPIGIWNFDDPFDLLKSEGRSVLFGAYKSENGPEMTDDLESVGLVPVDGPSESNGAICVPADAYLWLRSYADSETLKNYTLLFDIRPADLSGYKAIFQNDLTNKADAGLFIKNNSIGRGGPSNMIGYVGELEAGRWYRLLLVVEESRAILYLDGKRVGESAQPQDFWNLNDEALLFADNDGEEGTVDVAAIRLYDYPLSDKFASELGDALSDEEEYFIVQTQSVKLINETDFSISVNANAPVTFELPEWIEPVDVESFSGEKAYKFRAQPMTATGRRTDVIVVESGFFEPEEVEVTQIFIGDELPEAIGCWAFEDPSDILAGFGLATLTAAVKAPDGSTTPVPVDNPAEAGIVSTSGPDDMLAATIPLDTYLRIEHNLGGDLNTFSVLMDIRPQSLESYNALFQSHPNNDDDGSLFTRGTQVGLNMNGLGYGGTLVPGQWHRIVFVVNENRMAVYIDGEQAVATNSSNTDRWILHETGYFFADDNREEGEIDVASLLVWDVALPTDHIVRLGDPYATDIRPVVSTPHTSVSVIYDLTGRPVPAAKLCKGLYIQGGQKVLIK